MAGVTGVDRTSRARVNAVSAQIRAAYPGLRVGVTVGSSPAPQSIVLPSGIGVRESWGAKGVALRILRAVATKSAVLLVLVPVVCALFLGQVAPPTSPCRSGPSPGSPRPNCRPRTEAIRNTADICGHPPPESGEKLRSVVDQVLTGASVVRCRRPDPTPVRAGPGGGRGERVQVGASP